MNNNADTFSISGRIRSALHAIEGIVEVMRSQHNAWLHALATLCVLAAGYAFGVSTSQWCFSHYGYHGCVGSRSTEYCF